MGVTERDCITVLFDRRPEDRTVRPFFCLKCGKCLCEVVGNVTMVVPGMPEGIELSEMSGTVELSCYGTRFTGDREKVRCDAKYLF